MCKITRESLVCAAALLVVVAAGCSGKGKSDSATGDQERATGPLKLGVESVTLRPGTKTQIPVVKGMVMSLTVEPNGAGVKADAADNQLAVEIRARQPAEPAGIHMVDAVVPVKLYGQRQ